MIGIFLPSPLGGEGPGVGGPYLVGRFFKPSGQHGRIGNPPYGTTPPHPHYLDPKEERGVLTKAVFRGRERSLADFAAVSLDGLHDAVAQVGVLLDEPWAEIVEQA